MDLFHVEQAVEFGSVRDTVEKPCFNGNTIRVLPSEVMKYPVALIQTKEGYSVCCPGLPGCWSQGGTEEEALANIRDAIREYLAVAKQLVGLENLREVEIST